MSKGTYDSTKGCLEVHYQYSTWPLLLREEKVVQVNWIRLWIFVLEAELSKLPFFLLVLQSTGRVLYML